MLIMENIVIVLDGAMGAVLSLCKSAKRNGFQAVVVCIDKSRCNIYEGSKYVKAVYYSSINDLLKTFYEICSSYQLKEKPLLYFTADIYCITVNKARESFSRVVTLCLPSSEIVNGFCYKNHSEDMAEANGLIVPRSISINNIQDIENVLSAHTFPVILKPLSVKNSQSVGFKYQILDKNEFNSIKDEVWNSLLGKVLCQEYIPGDDNSYWFYSFFRNEQGDVIECMGEKTMQSNGIMAIGTTKYNPELSQISRDFLRRIQYVGIGGIEYKKYGDRYYFIEMSTRTEGFLPISDMAGVSIADASFQHYLDKDKFSKEKIQRDNVKYISILSVIAEILRKKSMKVVFHAIYLMLFKMKGYPVEFYFKDGSFARFIRQIIKQKIK